MTRKQAERLESITELLQLRNIRPGDTIYTSLRSVSRSGMSRKIDVFIMRDNQPININRHVSEIAGYTLDKSTRAVKTTGCGMDMGFNMVYNLSRCLFPDGFGVKCSVEHCGYRFPKHPKHLPGCPPGGICHDMTGHKFFGRNGDPSGWDNDGGYALNQEWLL